MRIAINCRSFLTPQVTGIGRYAKNLVSHLGRIDTDNDYILYARKGLFDRKRRLPRAASQKFRVRADYFGMGIDRTVGKVDVYHSPSPDRLGTQKKNIVVSVHDLVYKTFPESHTPSTVALSEVLFNDIAARASKIICCSRSTRDDLHRFFDISHDRSCVVYHGVDHEVFYPLDDEERIVARRHLESMGIRWPFLLFVGTLEPRKNITSILKAFAMLKSTGRYQGSLVIAGMKGWMMEDLHRRVDDLGIQGSTIFLGYLKDYELRYVYNFADIFVFPSFYEGFGFPIVEAFACGTPVITSNVSSCAEIARGAAHLVDPKSVDELSAAILRVSREAGYRNTMKEQGLIRAREFSFGRNARETLEVYRTFGF